MSACPYPTIKFIAYESRQPAKIFVPDPAKRGRYIYTDRCVALVACPQCKAIPGEPCKRHYDLRFIGESLPSYHSSTHSVRRMAVPYGRNRAEDIVKEHVDIPLELTEADL